MRTKHLAKKYKVTFKPALQREPETVTAENVHVTAQGNVKLLNGKGSSAELMAFFNSEDVTSVVVVDNE